LPEWIAVLHVVIVDDPDERANVNHRGSARAEESSSPDTE
jgi:hypothetical protein